MSPSSALLNSISKRPFLFNTATTTHLCCFLGNLSVKTICHTSEEEEPTGQPSLTVSYLIHSCGLSPKAALSASQQIQLKTTENPDSVLVFLMEHGFTKTQITSLVTRRPCLLSSNPRRNLMPKMEFFHNIGVSGSVLAKLVVSYPSILCSSLKNTLIPSFDFLKSILHTTENVITALGGIPWPIFNTLHKTVAPNIETLRNQGVPESTIFKLALLQLKTLMRNPDPFALFVAELKEMGFGPSNPMFVYALAVRSGMSKSTWERKVAVYRSFGCSEDEILSSFRKTPVCLQASEEKIRRAMDFFMNKLNLRPANVLAYPTLISLSLEKTIVPRCSVLNVLMLKGVIKRDISVLSSLNLSKARFLNSFVIKYQEEVPEVLKAYQGKVEFVGFEVESQDAGGSQ